MTNKILSLDEAYNDEISDHRKWLSQIDPRRLMLWENLFQSEPEAAICEACLRFNLSDKVDQIEPYQDLSLGGPDYKCCKNGKYFYIEVTCLKKETVTRKTGLESIQLKASGFATLTGTILNEVCNKTPQCSGLDGPCLIAVATLHFSAGSICLNGHFAEDILTGTPHISVPIDMKKGEAIGEPRNVTDLRDSAFIRFSKTQGQSIEYARNPISGILLCPFGGRPINLTGVLHPNPNHVFDPKLLPGVKFCRIKGEHKEGELIDTEWIE